MSKGPTKVIINKEPETNKDDVDLSDLLGVAPASRPKQKSKSKRKSSTTIRPLQRHQSSAAKRRSSVSAAKAAAAKRRRLSAKARRSKLRSKKRHDNDDDNRDDIFDQKLFGCFKNTSICIWSLVLPCYVQGKIAYKVDRSCLLYGFLCALPVINIICRVKVRELVRIQNDISGSTAKDCLAVMCYPCSLSQEAFELDALLKPRDNSMVRE